LIGPWDKHDDSDEIVFAHDDDGINSDENFAHANFKGLLLGSEKDVDDTHDYHVKEDGLGSALNHKLYPTTWGENYDDDVEYNLVDELPAEMVLYKAIPNVRMHDSQGTMMAVDHPDTFDLSKEMEERGVTTVDLSKEMEERGVHKVPSNALVRRFKTKEVKIPSKIPMVGGFIDKTPWNGELVKGDLPEMDLPPKNKVRKKDSTMTNGESVERNPPDNETTDEDQVASIERKFSGSSGVMIDDNSEDLPSNKWKFSGSLGVTIDNDLPLLQDYEFNAIEYEDNDPDDKSRGAMSELMPSKTSWDVDSCDKSPMAGLMVSEERQDDNPACDDDSDHGMSGMISRKWMDLHLDNVYDGENAMGFTTPMQDNIRKATRVTSGEETMNPGVKDVSSAKFHTAKFHAPETETTERHGEIPHGETETTERHGEIPHGEITAPETETMETHVPHGETETTERQSEIPHGEITEKHEETTHGETMSVSQFYPSDSVGWMFSVKKQEDGPRFCVRIVEETEQRENERPSCWNTMIEWEPGEACRSPLVKGDHLDTDTTKLLDASNVQMYMSLTRAMQWTVLSGQSNISRGAMTLLDLQAAPCIGYLGRAKQWTVLSGPPNISRAAMTLLDLRASPCIGHFGRAKHTYGYPGRAVTGILDFVNGTPLDWYHKEQATVETVTYGSQFVDSKTCVERDINLRTLLRYLGVPIYNKAYMFGDNESVVNSSSTPHVKLHKRHNALSFHRVREAVAIKIIGYYHIRSETNPSDVLSKHWGYSQVWPLLRCVLFWRGDTALLLTEQEEQEEEQEG
jgi:hypothetical protein